MHTHKPKFPANPWNMLGVSAAFLGSVSADYMLTVHRAKKLGPSLYRANSITPPKEIYTWLTSLNSNFFKIVCLG